MEGFDRLPRARALTEYPPRSSTQEWPQHYAEQHSNMPHYSPSASLGYMTPSHQTQYSPYTSTYPSYSPTYMSGSGSSQGAIHWPTTTSSSMQYSVRPPPRSATLPSQHRILSRNYYPSSTQAQRQPSLQLRTSMAFDFVLMDTEEQDSVNRETMRSEPIEPALQGYPRVEDFDDLMKKYGYAWLVRKDIADFVLTGTSCSFLPRSKTRL